MLTVKEKGLLLNIIKHCEKINLKIKGLTKESFNNDEDINVGDKDRGNSITYSINL